jgi:hypothetical protein
MMFAGGVAFIALGVCLVVWTAVQLWLARVSVNWPWTRGTILTAEVYETETGDERARYRVALSYTYEVGGTRYTGKRVHFGYAIGGEEQDFAEVRARKYAPGRQVTIRYSPDDPQESVLEASMSTRGLMSILMWGVTAIVFGVFFVQRS